MKLSLSQTEIKALNAALRELGKTIKPSDPDFAVYKATLQKLENAVFTRQPRFPATLK